MHFTLLYYLKHARKGWIGRKMYRYAHNDVLQFIAEYGAVGSALLGLALMSGFASGWQLSLSTFWLSVGVATAFAHALLDFIFHSPSYWMCLSLAVSAQPTCSASSKGGSTRVILFEWAYASKKARKTQFSKKNCSDIVSNSCQPKPKASSILRLGYTETICWGFSPPQSSVDSFHQKTSEWLRCCSS